ncbi:unnamed protein product [Arctia plantaginis]|uniref:FAM194 C-terminal domain-containing protein n=1 Tax=Arctia plantaginis TaxID=874455 RepID=A0A8S1A2H8_ARCPL|nr:unnamed protein product [Arctia plantaginis]
MGTPQVEISIHCPYCCKKETCDGFQEIGKLIETGWVIYRHTDRTEYKSEAAQAGRSTSTNRNVFVLYKRKQQNKNMATADLLSPLDLQKIPCPRCRLKLEYAQILINSSPTVNRTDVLSICDHCLLKMKTEGPCHKCANILNKFLAARGEQEKYKNKYFKSWLTETEHQINKSISEVKPTIQRSYSEININLPSRDTSKTVIKCKVQELFHSELNLTDTNRKKEIKQPKNLVPGLEKTVNFTDLIEMFHTVSSDSVVKNCKTERDSFYEQNEYDDLKLRSSSGAAHIRSSIAKTSKHQDETEQMMEEKEDYLKEHKISYKDKFGVESEKSFVFPQTQQKPDKNLKRYISSPELIQDIREKLRLKVEEEENKKKEELELKVQEKKIKKLAREEKNVIKDELLHKEALSEAKLMDVTSKIDKSGPLKPETESVGKYPKREDDLMIQQEVIGKRGTKDKGESSKELELHKRLGKDKAAEFDKEKIIKTKMDDQKEKTLVTTQVKEIIQSKIKDKFDKHKKTKDIKEKETLTPIIAEEVKVSELKKHKDHHKMDKHKQSKDVAGLEKKAEKSEGINIISKLNPKKEGASKDVAGVEKQGGDIPSKEIHKLSKGKPDKVEELKEVKGHEKKRDSLHPTEVGKSEKANIFEDSKQNDVKLNQVKLLKPSADDLVAQLIKVNNKVLAKDSIKNKLPELPKVEELKEVKGHEKKRDALHLTEIGKSEKANNLEDSKQNDVKLNQVKLIKPSVGDLVTQLIKVNNKVLAKDSIKTKLPELPKLEELKEAKHLEKKRDDLQATEIGKSEKANNLEDSKQNDVKLNQVKLRKSSAGDLITQLIKVNNKVLEKDSIKPKLPELSKLLLETTKTKEKLAEKLTSTRKPNPKDDTVDLPSKEKQEKELKMSQVKLVESSFDNLILRLIKIRPAAGERSVNVHKIEAVKIKKRHRLGGTTTTAEEDEESAEEFSLREEPKSLGREGEQTPICPPKREGQDIQPIYVQLKLSEISSLAPLQAVEEAQLETEDGKKAQLEMSKKKTVEPIDPEAGKGVIRYALSDRTFIEKGWTMLPVEKVVRKMNIYRMRPAQPEFDWFEHNKKKGLMVYDTGAKLAEFDDNGRGRWFYKNGCLALDYYEAEETNTQQRFVVYSNGEVDERGRSHPITILATFDHLGNGVVFDHAGKIRLKYNQTEGVLLDRSVGPVTNWKWHSLNDPPVLQQVMIDTQMPLKDPNILKMGGPADNRTRPDNEEMLAIEFDNFIKEKSKKLTQKFKPFQIKMKALKINDHFSLKVLDQATIYLIFRDGSANLKLNIGMVLDHKEIVDTDTAELGEVSNSMERFPARTDSLAALQRSVAYARRYERMRTEREYKLRRPESSLSADNLGKAASRPLRPPLRTLGTFETGVTSPFEASSAYCKCNRKPSSSLYYNTQLL